MEVVTGAFGFVVQLARKGIYKKCSNCRVIAGTFLFGEKFCSDGSIKQIEPDCFAAASGGLLNLETFRRAIEQPDAELVLSIDEGTFHQVHSGVAITLLPRC
jgi:hypothetical protein